MLFMLSKINLLILVVALFTIVVYFTFGFQDVLIKEIARQEVDKILKQAAYLFDSENICGTIELSIPEKLQTAAGQGYYFVMEIRAMDVGEFNSLIFSVIERSQYFLSKRKGEEPPISASGRKNLSAELHIFSLNEDDELCPSHSSILGGNIGAIPIDNIVIVKEVYKGDEYIYIIPCSSANKDSCEHNRGRIACWIEQQRGEKTNCIDTPDDCMDILNVMNTCAAVS